MSFVRRRFFSVAAPKSQPMGDTAPPPTAAGVGAQPAASPPPSPRIVPRLRTGSMINDAILKSRPSAAHDVNDDHVMAPQSLSEVLRSPKLRFAFRQYLRKHSAAESLLFFETVELFESIDNPSWRQRTGQGILDKFIMPGSVHEVNLPSALRSRLLAAGEKREWDDATFAKAKRELYVLMDSNYYESFVDVHWPGGVRMCKPGDPFGELPRAFGSWEQGDARGLGSGSTSTNSARPEGSNVTVGSNGHLHDDETQATLAFLEV